MNTPRRILSVLVPTVVTVAAVGCGHHEAEQSPSAFQSKTVTTAVVEKVTAERTIEARGIVQPGREAFVSSRVMGPVVAVRVTAGTAVSAGQALIEIQPEAPKQPAE